MGILQFHQYLQETTLSHQWALFTDTAKVAGIISASRGEFSAHENARRTVELAGEVRGAGYGYVFADGKYIETKADGSLEDVLETVLIINGSHRDEGRLKGLLRQWRVRYGQESAILKPCGTDHILLLTASGEEDLGVFHPNKVSALATQIRGRGGHRQFVFEGAYMAMGWFGRVADHMKKRLTPDTLE